MIFDCFWIPISNSFFNTYFVVQLKLCLQKKILKKSMNNLGGSKNSFGSRNSILILNNLYIYIYIYIYIYFLIFFVQFYIMGIRTNSLLNKEKGFIIYLDFSICIVGGDISVPSH